MLRPSKTNYTVLDLLQQGDRLSVGRGGTYRFWDSGVPVHYQQIQWLLKHSYIVEGPRGNGKAVIHTEMRITQAGRDAWTVTHDMIGVTNYFNNPAWAVGTIAVGKAARSEEYADAH